MELLRNEDKENFFQSLSEIYDNLDIPAIIGGYFIILRFDNEKNKKVGVNSFYHDFNIIISDCALRDLILSREQYTWSNNQANPTLEKLDKILINGDT
jgi:hypothetical protein